jgi:LysR family transcriptional regulator, transcriptional activator for dmlA
VGDASADDVLFFDVVAKASSLTEAARELGVSVSSVSKRLTRIERRLGVHLIQRTTRRLALTTEGERYAARAAVIAVELVS